MYPYSTHCANNSSTKPGSPKTPTVRAFSRFSPSATPVTAAVAFTAHRARNPSAVFIEQLQGKAQGRPEDPQQCDEEKSQQQAGNDFLIQVHTAPPLADPAATGSRAFSTRR